MTIDTNKAREIAGKLLDQTDIRIRGDSEMEEQAAALLLALADAHDKMLALLVRYRNETPLGHQPHMIAYEADAAIDAAMGESAMQEAKGG